MTKTKIKIDIVSDVVCPWCYIGKRRLEKAIEKVSGKFDFELEYHPFELNPNMPKEGTNQKEYLVNKFGGEERYDQLTQHVTDIAAQEGLLFNFNIQPVSPNTRPMHAIIQLAKEEGKQLEMVEAFFKAYFTTGIDLSKQTNIITIAENAGLEKEKVKNCLMDSMNLLKIEAAENEIAKLGIRGVPYYIIDNKYGVSGAQPPEKFIQAFEEIGTLERSPEAEACRIESKHC